ncbi:MAG: HAD family hydrolase [Clostridiales bacterium]|nr:HAD family hydrolase [Clostridiales bacterium]
MNIRMLLFDLDGTLLRTDKTISSPTLDALQRCREKGLLIGVATSRGEQNALGFLAELKPDAVISSAGALTRCNGSIVHTNGFTGEETHQLIATLRACGGAGILITVDGLEEYFRNYQVPPDAEDQSWGSSTFTDFSDFHLPSLKICFETTDATVAERIATALPHCDCIHFSDGPWYKLTPKTATKENAILHMCRHLAISPDQIIAFGDDLADIGMLRLCGVGVAMGNAIDPVKAIADRIIGTNDEDGIAVYLDDTFHK